MDCTLTTPPAVDHDIRPIVYSRENATPQYRSDVGHTKRFLERYAADGSFRDLLARDPAAAVAQWGLVKDADEMRPLWDRAHPRCAPVSQAVARFRAFGREKFGYCDELRQRGTPGDARWRAWRSRQMARCIGQLGSKARVLIHAPFCIELGKGCSVGCWFCAVSAARLGEQWACTPTNRAFWRDCLDALVEVTGDGARAGYCYWGNDPFDNPDYESFLLDFHERIGAFPQTTTAQADRYPERVKAFLRLSEEKGGLLDRFSIITLKQWQRVHEMFDAESLLFVECVPQNKEALDPTKVLGGRAREVHLRRVAQGREAPRDPDTASTIACVSGFYLNMVDRTVKLITPCNASDRWPLGHWTYETAGFTDARDLRRVLTRMIADHMRVTLRHDDVVAFRDDLVFTPNEDGFTAATRFHTQQIRVPSDMRELPQLIWQGGQHAADLALACDVPLDRTFHYLNTVLFDRGLLDEEPMPPRPSAADTETVTGRSA